MNMNNTEIPIRAFSVGAFCTAFAISRAQLYRLWQAGQGPAYYSIGRRRLIAAESATAWQRSLQEAATTPEQTA
jgi:hypothetical protein